MLNKQQLKLSTKSAATSAISYFYVAWLDEHISATSHAWATVGSGLLSTASWPITPEEDTVNLVRSLIEYVWSN